MGAKWALDRNETGRVRVILKREERREWLKSVIWAWGRTVGAILVALPILLQLWKLLAGLGGGAGH